MVRRRDFLAATGAFVVSTAAKPRGVHGKPKDIARTLTVAKATAYQGELTGSIPTTASEIIAAALGANSEADRPLPLIGMWSTSSATDVTNVGFTPAWQMDQISAGHHLLPWFPMLDPRFTTMSPYTTYYAGPLAAADAAGLPISVLSTQWEDDLSFQPEFYELTGSSTPLVRVPGVAVNTTFGEFIRGIGSGGSGYQVGDVLTVVGGTGTVAAQITLPNSDYIGGGGAAQWGIVTLGGTYTSLPSNPVSVTGGHGSGATFNLVDGSHTLVISPYGAVSPWESVGTNWAQCVPMEALQGWYPSPPLVLIISNNEATKLGWAQSETDQSFIDLWGTGNTDEFKREKAAAGWIERYTAMLGAFRDSLSSSAWRDAIKFIGYEAFGPRHFGRWGGWKGFSLYNTDRIDPSPVIWDGGSPSYYMDGNPGSDDKVFSPQVEAMNYQFMLEEAYSLNPAFWFELSSWQGCDASPTDPDAGNRCVTLDAQYPDYSPARYAGMVQFGLWLTRPRTLREYRNSTTTRAAAQPLFDALAVAVDRIHSNPTLHNFWRFGTIVANTSRAHPYQSDIPSEYASANRMFMLTTDLDDASPWDTDTGLLPVCVLARVIGSTPSRTWLLYAFSPAEDRASVLVTIPGVGDVTIGATIAGSFYTVPESTLIPAAV